LGLRSAHPEWSPWLSVIERVISAANERSWEDAVPPRPRREIPLAPLLMHASITVRRELVDQWLKILYGAAANSGTNELATLKRAGAARAGATECFHAALTQKTAVIDAMARDLGIDIYAFRSVMQLLPIPLLHACRRVWSEADNESWTQGYCPLCGAWPALAEVRGIERSRYLRCGRCGGQWPAQALRCTFCGIDDHEQLLSLVPDAAGANQAVEACKPCRGYLKVLTVLQAGDASVMLEDLASVDLDIAAIEQGFCRPDGLGYPIEATIVEEQPARFSWRH
jgi:FdhE protein